MLVFCSAQKHRLGRLDGSVLPFIVNKKFVIKCRTAVTF